MTRPARLFRSHDTRRSALITLFLVLAVVFLAADVASRLGVTTPGVIEGFIERFGVLAPVAFVLLQAAQVVAAPIPGQVLAFLAGYLFGPWLGTAYAVLGAGIGSYAAFALSRRFGRPYVERVFDKRALEWFDAFSTDNGLLALFVVFLVPGLPDDLVCFVAGLTDLDIRKMTAVAVVGRTPGFFLTAFAGSSTANGHYTTALVVLVAVSVVGAVAWRYRDALRAVLTE